MLLRLLIVVTVVSLSLGGCASPANDPLARPDDAAMTLVYLETGPNSATNTPEQKQEIFRGHMANMQRLADEHTLIIAGPFTKPHDPTWRGIFVFDVADVDKANAIGATDPGVISGEFKLRIRPITASGSLREALRLEDEMQAELEAQGGAERKPGEPPPGLRPYVIVHAADIKRAWRGLNALAPEGPGVIWWARFRDGSDGVIVLDARKPDEVQPMLDGADMGPLVIDGWYSTQALERLPESTRMAVTFSSF